MRKSILTIFLFIGYLVHSQTIAFVHDGITRDCNLHLPTGYNPANKYPLVLNLHGYTSNALQQQFYTKMDSMADAAGFIVAYPNGVSNAWNSGFVGSYGTGIDDVEFISFLIDTIKTRYSVNDRRVYSCGMSNGGFQSYRMACELNNKIAAIASVTGTFTDSTKRYCNPGKTVPVMEVHGTADGVVPYAGSVNMVPIEQTIAFWNANNGCSGASDTVLLPNTSTTDNSTVQYIRFTSCSSGSENWFYRVIGGGHTWPGSIFDIPADITNRDFSASQAIWTFFNMYDLDGYVGFENRELSRKIYVLKQNPVGKTLYFSVPLENTSIGIYDINGRNLMFQSDFNGDAIELTNLASGNYILKVSNKDFSSSSIFTKD